MRSLVSFANNYCQFSIGDAFVFARTDIGANIRINLSFFVQRKEVGTGRSNLGRFRFLRKKCKTKSILGANIVNLFRNTKFYAIIFEN